MQFIKHTQHPWSLPLKKAMALQKELSEKVIFSSGAPLTKIKTVAGIDTHFDGVWAVAAVVNLNVVSLETVGIAISFYKAATNTDSLNRFAKLINWHGWVKN